MKSDTRLNAWNLFFFFFLALLLIAAKSFFKSLVAESSNTKQPIPKKITHSVNMKKNTTYWKVTAKKYPMGLLQSNGNLRIEKNIGCWWSRFRLARYFLILPKQKRLFKCFIAQTRRKINDVANDRFREYPAHPGVTFTTKKFPISLHFSIYRQVFL